MMDDKMITAQRIADFLTARGIAFEQKKMFGGICFMVNDKMCVGTSKGRVMARVDPEEEETLLQRTGATLMDHKGHMPGFLMIEADGYDRDADLSFWVDKCLEYNPKAKASKRKVR